MVKRLNKTCRYFPCHKGLEDCTFCYCPFYPCLDGDFGEHIYSPRLKKNVWSCQNCSRIHKKKMVDEIFKLIKQNGFMKIPNIENRTLKTERLKIGVIILGHGSKLKKANNIVFDIVKTVKRKLGLSIIVPAYLQFYQPSLPESIKNLVTKGCERIIIVPFFLFAGNHVRRDMPKVIKKEKVQYPKVSFIYTKNLGEDIRVGEIVIDRIKEAISLVCD